MAFEKYLNVLSGGEFLYEFANLTQRDTGIQNIVIHCYSQGDVELNHSPRIKVSNVYGKYSQTDNFSLDFQGNVKEGEVKIKPKELKLVKLWKALNKDILLEYWKTGVEMATSDFIDSIQKI